MIPHFELMEQVQARSGHPEDRGTIAMLSRNPSDSGRFVEKPFGHTRYQPHGCDLFWTPLRFKGGRRSNENVRLPAVLFADGDDAPIPHIEPSLMWWTSTGNWQAIWYLSEAIDDYEVWADLNRRLTYHLNADRGGWMGSKLLRVPESVNWKRRDFGRMALNTGREYAWASLDRELPVITEWRVMSADGEHPSLLAENESMMLIAKQWNKLSLRSRSKLMADRVRDRSMHIIIVARLLKEDDIDPVVAFHMLWWRPWNKWRVDRERPDRLWYEIQAVWG